MIIKYLIAMGIVICLVCSLSFCEPKTTKLYKDRYEQIDKLIDKVEPPKKEKSGKWKSWDM